MFLVYAVIFIIGIAIAGWLFIKDMKQNEKSKSPSLLKRLGIEPPEVSSQNTTATEISSQIQEGPSKTPQEPPSISEKEIQAALEEPLSQETAFFELKERYERLEKLFQEKGEEFEKIQNALNAELKAKREFNKLKDLLERELKDTKDNSHKQQLEIGALNAEIENYKKRISQLEDKIKAKDEDIKQKEQQINDLIKRIQTFAAPSPAQAPSLPPVQEQKVEQAESKPTAQEQQSKPEETKPTPAQEQQPKPEEAQSIETTEEELPKSDSNITQGQTVIRQPPKQPSS